MNNKDLMTIATSKRPIEKKPSTKKASASKPQSISAAIQSSLSTSKLIQNLGSSNKALKKSLSLISFTNSAPNSIALFLSAP